MESMRAEQLASEDTPADETANVAATPDDTSGCDENVSAKRTMDSMYGGDGRGADATARTRRRFSRDTRAKRIDTKKPGHFLTSFQQVNDLLDQLFDIYGEDAEAMAQQMLQQFLGELNFSSANALDQFVNDKKIDAQTKADIYAALENTFGALVGDFKDRLQRRNEANSPSNWRG
jgi:predicted AlkP superfamily pyrophosphatase or phosphodiesterase